MKIKNIKKNIKTIPPSPKKKKALHASEYLLNGIIDQSPYPMWISDHKGTLIRINRALLDLLHISEEEVLGRYNVLSDNIVAEQGHLPLVKRVFDSGETVRFEIKYDSSQLKHLQLARHVFVILNVTIFPIKDARGKITNAVIQHMDITEQKLAEEALLESEIRFRTLFNEMNEAASLRQIIYNEDKKAVNYKILDINPQYENLLNFKRETVVGKLATEIYKTHDPPFLAEFAGVVETGQPYHFENYMKPVDKYFYISASPMGKDKFATIYFDITERKRAEETVRESEQRFMVFMEHLPAAVFIKDQSDRLLFANRYLKEFFGWDKYNGKTSKELLPYDIAGKMAADDRRVINEGSMLIQERIIDIHGKEHFFDTYKFPIPGEGGSMLLGGIAVDISKRIRAERELSDTKVLLQYAIEQSPIPMTLLNAPDGTVLNNNQACYKILGIEGEDHLGKCMTEINPTWQQFDTEGKILSLEELPLTLALQGITTRNKEIIIQRKDGTRRWYTASSAPIYNDAGEMIAAFAVFPDITELKQAEEALRKSAEQYHIITNTAMDGFTIVDTEGHIMDANEAFCRMTGYGRDELLAMSIPDLDAAETEAETAGHIRKIMDTGSDIFESRLRCKDGRIIDVEISTTFSPQSAQILIFQRDITERKRAEESLRASEERFKRLVESVTDYIYTVKIENDRPVFTSHGLGCIAVTGYTPEDYKANPHLWYRMIHEDDRKAVTDQTTKIFSSNIFLPLEHRIIHKNGTIRWVRNTPVPRFINGRLAAYDGLISDITERKQAEEALRNEKEFTRALLENITGGVVACDARGKLAMFNRTAREWHGTNGIALPLDQVADYYNLYSFDGTTMLPAESIPLARAFRGEEFRDIGMMILIKDQPPRYILASGGPFFDDQHNKLGAVVVMHDVTERKLAEEALRLSEEKYRDIFERAVEGIFQCYPNGGFINVNPAFALMHGYESPAEIIASIKNIVKETFVNPEASTRFIQILEKYGKIEEFENQYYTKDGGKIWTSTNARAVRNIDGKILYYEGTVVNITERKKAEEEKERLHSQLRQAQKMEAIGTLAGGIAHDFNNILSIITGYGTLLQMELDKSSILRTYVEQILNASGKATNLTHSLLAFSRKQPVALKPVRLNEIIKGTKQLLKRLLTEDITLKENLTHEDIVMMGDSTQIDQILFNLATNARDAMPKGGTLTIETKITELDADFIDVLGYGGPGTYALLSLSDTGIGMDERTKEHIFDPFFTTKEIGKGTGLGLSTVYGIVKQHNGYIIVYSEPDMGTTFHIYFPAITAVPENEKQDAKQITGGHEIILVAEDNGSVRQLIRTILTRYGYTILEAVDGEDALDKFKKYENIDLMIIDSVMPKKNGREVYDEINKINPDIKALFISGYTRDVILDKGIEEKEIDFISKPLTPNTLLVKVREILDRE